MAQILDIVAPSHLEGLSEKCTFGTTCTINFCLDTHVDFLPESRYRTHAGGVYLPQCLLYFLWIRIDDQPGTLCETQNSPSPLKHMRIGQEIHHHILFRHWHRLVVGLKRGMILPVGEDDTFAVARSATGIKDVADIIE